MTGTPYLSVSDAAIFLTSSDSGLVLFKSTTNGFLRPFSSDITLPSASSYSLRGISLIEPSVVMTSPIVECSLITFCVPISAAILNGISCSNHGVFTIRGLSPSI